MPQRNDVTLQIQRALLALGFPPGPLDGVPGTKTTAAIRAYQVGRKLVPDGVVGPKTLAALKADGHVIVQHIGVEANGWSRLEAAVDGTRPWLDYARSQIGVAEIVGPRHSPTILGWLKELGTKRLGVAIAEDETAWCGTFLGICILRSLPNEPLPAILVRARAWEDFGVGLEIPSLGAVIVFERKGGGHVAFYEGEDDTHYHVVGGNQGNRVSRMRLEKNRMTAIRWPKTVPLPKSGRIRLNPAGEISDNEA